MITEAKAKPPWTLIVKNDKGKEVKAGRFLTEFLAAQFARDYKLTDWRVEGPYPSVFSNNS